MNLNLLISGGGHVQNQVLAQALEFIVTHFKYSYLS